jgi:hypothetical protein
MVTNCESRADVCEANLKARMDSLEKKLNSDFVKLSNRLDKCAKDLENNKADAVKLSSETKEDVKISQQQLNVCENKFKEANKAATDKVMWSEIPRKLIVNYQVSQQR